MTKEGSEQVKSALASSSALQKIRASAPLGHSLIGRFLNSYGLTLLDLSSGFCVSYFNINIHLPRILDQHSPPRYHLPTEKL